MMSNSTIECTEQVIIMLMAEIERLNKENMELKIDNELLLHNIMRNNNIDNEVINNNEGGWTDEEFDVVANAYAKLGDR